jgi:hypothetical protein
MDLRHEPGSISTGQVNWNLSKNLDHINETLEDLGGSLSPSLDIESLSLELPNLAVVLNGEKDFNRYRGTTLRSDFYTTYSGFKVDHHRQHCRQQEPKCKAAAMNLKDWTDSRSEKIFGTSQTLGDLGLSGSAKWKERAISSFLLDILLKEKGIRLLRLSIYDGMLLGGKLITLKELLLKRDEKTEKILVNWLNRQISSL